MAQTEETVDGDSLMSLRAASVLTGLPRAYLKERVEAGTLAVHHVPRRGEVTWRVSRMSLVEAGLCAEEQTELASVIKLLREQGERLAGLEEQRFLMAGQLGMALERTRHLEEELDRIRLSTIESESSRRPLMPNAHRFLATGFSRFAIAPARQSLQRLTPITRKERDGT